MKVYQYGSCTLLLLWDHTKNKQWNTMPTLVGMHSFLLKFCVKSIHLYPSHTHISLGNTATPLAGQYLCLPPIPWMPAFPHSFGIQLVECILVLIRVSSCSSDQTLCNEYSHQTPLAGRQWVGLKEWQISKQAQWPSQDGLHRHSGFPKLFSLSGSVHCQSNIHQTTGRTRKCVIQIDASNDYFQWSLCNLTCALISRV